MGNSNSQQPNHTHSHQPFHPAFHHRGDLIRNGGAYPHMVVPPPPAKIYNPECKVLPERIPGQKLRLTDNGAILQNGGTISGRLRADGLPPGPGPGPGSGPDAEFMQYMLMRRRTEDMHMAMSGVLPPDARYYSQPELATVQESHGDETDNSTSGRRFRKKSRAPPPPLSLSALNGSLGGNCGDRPASRTSSVHEAMPQQFHGRGPESGLVKIQPWQQRPMNGTNSPLTLSMEKIVERHQLVLQESRLSSSSPNAGPPEAMQWCSRQKDRPKNYDRQQQPLPSPPRQRTTEITISHERRFYKNRLDNNSKKLSQSEQQLCASSNHSSGSSSKLRMLRERGGFVNEEPNRQFHSSNSRQQPRAKSMDSLQVALEAERKARLEHLHRDIYRNNSSDRPSSRQSKDNGSDNFHRTSSMDGKLLESSVKRPPSRSREIIYSTGSLQRNISGKMQYEDYTASRKELLQNESHHRPRQRSPANSRDSDPKMNIRLNRKDFLQPKPYYYGEVHTEEQERNAIQSALVNHHRQKSGSDSGSSRQLSSLEVPAMKQKSQKSSKETFYLDNRNGDFATQNGPRPGNSTPDVVPPPMNDLRQVKAYSGQGRNRNSYAFEDRRYRYDMPAHELPSPNHREPMPSSVVIPIIETVVDDEMDISMQLRPMLPKRTPAIPRFSPTQAWRSLNLDYITNGQKSSDRSSDDGDIFEDRIHRVTRPVAPPRMGNERSADSGISQDAGSPGGLLADNELIVNPDKRSTGEHHHQQQMQIKPLSSISPPLLPLPLPLSAEPSSLETNLITEPGISPIQQQRAAWTPEEDLASDFDGGSVDHVPTHSPIPEMVSVPPKLTPMKSMFASRTFVDIEDTKRKGQGKKPKTKGSSASTRGKFVDELQNVDENWSFSRSLPNSLHNGHSGEETPSSPTKSKPKLYSDEFPGQFNMRRFGSGPIHPSPKLSLLQTRVMSMDCLQDLCNPSKNHENQISDENGDRVRKFSKNEHIIYLPEYDAKRIVSKENEINAGNSNSLPRCDPHSSIVYVANNLKKGKKFSYQSTVRQQQRKRLEQKLSQEVAHKEKLREREILLVNKVEEEFQKKREREKASICLQLKVLSDSCSDLREGRISTPPPPLMSASQLSLYTEELSSSSSPLSSQPSDLSFSKASPHGKLEKQDSGFFSGISKWMRRQQKLEEQQQQHAESLIYQKTDQDADLVRFDPHEFNRQMELLDPRQEILNAAKFSSGIIPPESLTPEHEAKAEVYSRLSQLEEEEEKRQMNEMLNLDHSFFLEIEDKEKFYRKHKSKEPKGSSVQVHRSGSGRAVESAAEVKQQKEGRARMSNHHYMANSSNSSFEESTASLDSNRRHFDNVPLNKRAKDHYLLNDRSNGPKLRSSIEDSECSSDIETDNSATPKQHSRYRSPKNQRKKRISRSSSREGGDEEVNNAPSAIKKLLGRKKIDKGSKDSKMNGHNDGLSHSLSSSWTHSRNTSAFLNSHEPTMLT